MSYIAKVNDETFFKTDSDDITLALSSASLSLKAGSAGTFDFNVETTNRKYGQFRKNIDYIDVYRNAETAPIFSGRVAQTGRDFYLNDSVSVEGILSYFSDSIFRPITHEGTLGGYLNLLITNHNSQVEPEKRINLGLIEIDRNQACYRELENYETTISRLQDLVESFGGYLNGRKTANGVLYMDWLADANDGTTQRIDFGRNLIDLNITESMDAVYTMLIPLGADDEETEKPITIESVNSGKDYLLAPQSYLNQYGYVCGVVRWEDVTVPANLKTKAQEFLEENLKPRITIDITAADLADCGYDYENFKIGQKILVNSTPHGITNEWFRCTEQNLDLLDPANNTLSLGEEKIGYINARNTDTVNKILERIAHKYPTSSQMQSAIENATTLITGNQGGYVILYDSNGDDKPDEILVMDSMDKDTARKVWRWNKSGLGYSNNGYNGPFGLAMTIDGAIVADYITTGHMHGDRITSQSITVSQLADNSVTEAKILSGSVTAVKISDGAVTANKIQAGAVTVGKIASNAITEEKILSGAVTAVKISDGAVTANKIQAGAVNADKIASNCITAAQIASNAITTDELAANAVEAGNIKAGAVTADKIAAGSISADKIASNCITASQIASNAITTDELAANAVEAGNIKAGAVTADKIATGAITVGKIADSAVTEAKILSGAVTAVKISDGAVTANKIQAGAVNASKIEANSITASQIASNAITTDELAANAVEAGNIKAGAVTADKIATGAITVGKIAENAVTDAKIVSGAVTAVKISDGAVTANKIQAGAVSADKIAAGSISADKLAAGAITADMITSGSMSADRISGGTLTLSSTSFEGTMELYDVYNNKSMDIDHDGCLNFYHSDHSLGAIAGANGWHSYTGSRVSAALGAGGLEVWSGNNMVCQISQGEWNNMLPGLEISGHLNVSGTKSRVASTEDYAQRLLYCYETASPMFGDVGEGVIGEDGFCYILIDPILAETIQNSQYQVFLQRYGEGECCVTSRSPSYFIVEGTPGLQFGWELKAKQIDFTQKRLEPYRKDFFEQSLIAFENPNNEIDYEEELIMHIRQIEAERKVV